MGFQSWLTADTGESISNRFSIKKTFPVYLHDDKGNVWCEKNYEGFGNFGGKNYWDLLAAMNGIVSKRKAVYLTDTKDKKYKNPNLTKTKKWIYKNEQAKQCPDQGFFYGRN